MRIGGLLPCGDRAHPFQIGSRTLPLGPLGDTSNEIGTRHVSDTSICGSLSFIFTHPPEDKKKHNSCYQEEGSTFSRTDIPVPLIPLSSRQDRWG